MGHFFILTGGLTAVIWTDFIQVVIMVLGAFILMIMSKYYVYSFRIDTRFTIRRFIATRFTTTRVRIIVPELTWF